MARKSRKTNVLTDSYKSEVCNQIKYKVAVYIRVSNEDIKSGGTSLENQQQIISNYINEKIDLMVQDIYIDDGYTGTNFNRPEFLRMLTDIESGIINCVIVKDQSRLSRNSIDGGYYLQKYFPLNNIRFIAITDNIDTSDDMTSNNMMMSLKNLINEQYSIEISKKLKLQKKMQREKGEWTGGRLPFGYIRKNNITVIDEEVEHIVKYIFELYKENKSIDFVCRELNTNKIKTPSEYIKLKDISTRHKIADFWNSITIYKILESEFYIGNMVQGMKRYDQGKCTLVKKEDWIITENTHTPIISKELFNEVQEILKANKVDTSNNAEKKYHMFLHKLICGDCKEPLRTEKRGKNGYKYFCRSSYKKYKGYCNNKIMILETEIKDCISEVMLKQTQLVVDNDVLLKNKMNIFKLQIDLISKEIIKLQNKIDNINKNNMLLYEKYSLSKITLDEYKESKNRNEIEINNLNEDCKRKSNSHTKLLKGYDELSKNIDFFKNVSSIEITQEIIDNYIDKIAIYGDGSIDIDFKFTLPYDLENMEVL